MSKPVCVYCGAPLEDDVYTCENCGKKNVNFNRAPDQPRIVREPVQPSRLGMGAEGFDLTKHVKAPKPVKPVKLPDPPTPPKPVKKTAATEQPVHIPVTDLRASASPQQAPVRQQRPVPPAPPAPAQSGLSDQAVRVLGLLWLALTLISGSMIVIRPIFIGFYVHLGGSGMAGGSYVVGLWVVASLTAGVMISAFSSGSKLAAATLGTIIMAVVYLAIMMHYMPHPDHVG